MTVDPEKVLPSWRFVLDPQMQLEAKQFFDFVSFWPPYGWSDPQIKRWVENHIIGAMPERWPMISKIDYKLDGLISKTLTLMTHRPRDLPDGYRYLFGDAFRDISDPDQVRAAFRFMIDHKLKGGTTRTVEPGEEEYDDARIISISSRTGDAVHRDDLGDDAREKLDKMEQRARVNPS